MEKKEKIILTGDRPTGQLHVGHYVGSLRRRVELQNSGEYDKIFIMIADAQALTDNADNPEKVRQNIIEVALDYLACGLDPEKSTLLIQSQIPELCELSFYYMNLVTVSRLQRNPTVKSEIQMRNFETSIPVGFFTYPISQAADITAFHATTVPVGEDQAPMIEQTKEIVHKFNSIYGETLTDPSDPGKVEGNPVFMYLEAFSTQEHFERYLPDYANLQELEDHYARGGLGDVKVKKFLNNVMQEVLEPIRNRRKEFAKDIPAIYEILKKGSEEAEAVAAVTLSEVKRAMTINYFEDAALIQEQAQKYSAE